MIGAEGAGECKDQCAAPPDMALDRVADQIEVGVNRDAKRPGSDRRMNVADANHIDEEWRR
ncbi:hypothetical protein D3C87_2040090 [compost metagenome]